MKGKKLSENLANFKEQAELSKELVSLHTDLPFKFDPKIYGLVEPDTKALQEIFKELDFQKFYEELALEVEAPRNVKSEVITKLSGLKGWLKKSGKKPLAVVLLIDGAGVSGRLYGLSLAISTDRICFIPIDDAGGAGFKRGGRAWRYEGYHGGRRG